MVKEMMRLIRISPPTPLCMTGIWRARISIAVAPISPNTAPDAPTVSEWGETSSAPSDPVSRDTPYTTANLTLPSAGSSICPSTYSTYMLKPMWIRFSCKKPPLRMRHHCPCATPWPANGASSLEPSSAPFWYRLLPTPPPVAVMLPSARNTPTLMAISA